MAQIEMTLVQERRMQLAEIKELMPLFLAVLTTLGGSIVWIFNRMDTKNKLEREFELIERNKLEKFFSDQISALKTEVHDQNKEIIQLRRELNTYVRHVGVLEGLLHANKIDFPKLNMVEHLDS